MKAWTHTQIYHYSNVVWDVVFPNIDDEVTRLCE